MFDEATHGGAAVTKCCSNTSGYFCTARARWIIFITQIWIPNVLLCKASTCCQPGERSPWWFWNTSCEDLLMVLKWKLWKISWCFWNRNCGRFLDGSETKLWKISWWFWNKSCERSLDGSETKAVKDLLMVLKQKLWKLWKIFWWFWNTSFPQATGWTWRITCLQTMQNLECTPEQQKLATF
jgi:hypothetical protein